MRIPLPKTLRGSKVLPKGREYLLNMAHIDGRLVSRPAVEAVTALLNEPRGQFEIQGVLFNVFGDKLYMGTGLAVVAGTIGGLGPVKWAIGFNHAVIVTGAADMNYTVTPAGVLTQVLAGKNYVDVCHIQGRFVYTPEDGGPAEWSEVGDGATVDPTSFFDAETQPDQNVMCEALAAGDLYIGGTDTFERFRGGGPVTAPFVQVQGAAIEVGYVGAKIKSTDSCIFLGKPKGGGFGFFVFADGGVQHISDAVIDELLEGYTPAQLAAVRAQRFVWRGAEWFTFEFPDRTLLLVNGQWHYIDTGITGFTLLGRFMRYSATLFDGVWYVQSTAGLNKLSALFQDTVGKFSRQIITFARSAEGQPIDEIGAIEMEMNNGTGAGTVGLGISTNGKIWTDLLYASRSAVGEYDAPLVWEPMGGFGMNYGYLGVGLYTTDNFEFAVDGLVAR